jgi:polyribonucleotide nucleotidyltransferase
MDFKVAGTRKGITALQMDIKISGITGQIMREALEQARHGRLFLLDKMDAELEGARETRSKFAPRIHTLQIPTDKIRDLIGPGGKVIRGIIEATGVKIDVDDTGRVNVASSDEVGLTKALGMINDLTAVPEVGKTYLGKVVRLAEFGAFVEIFPGTDGLLHISEIAEHRVKDVKDELREGDQVMVKVLGIEGNRIKLSRKALLKEQRQKLGLPEPGSEGGSEPAAPRPPRQERPEHPERQQTSERQPSSNASTIMIEGGDDFEESDEVVDEENEPNFNRADDAPVPAGAARNGGAAVDPNRRRRRRGRGGRGPGSGPASGGGPAGGRR